MATNKNPQTSPSPYQVKEDWLTTIFEWAGGKLLIIGITLCVISLAGFIYYIHILSSQYLEQNQLNDALNFIGYLQYGIIFGSLLFAGGMLCMFWGDIALPLVLFIVAVVFFTSEHWIGFFVQIRETNPESYQLVQRSLASIGIAGIILGIIAVITQIIDVSIRMRMRALYGAKGDLMKYGSGVKEQEEIRNVFMGKCWQLPFCRKFVREKCPIYHSRRTCWKERVGCMCEEDVIRGAMEGNVIPRDAVAAAKFIPYNRKLTPAQKAERCRQCVIYNEHQRQKYKLLVPLSLLTVGGIYVLFKEPLLANTHKMMQNFDQAFGRFTFATGTTETGERVASAPPGLLTEFILIALALLVLAQIMKVVEFCIFKLKI